MTYLPKTSRIKMPDNTDDDMQEAIDWLARRTADLSEKYDGSYAEFAGEILKATAVARADRIEDDEPINRSECLDVDGRPIEVGQIVENASDIKGYWNIAVVVKTEPAPAPDKYPGIRIYANDGKGGWVDPREARVIDSITPEQHEVIAERLEGESPRLRRMVWDLYQNPHSDRPTDANGEVLEPGDIVAPDYETTEWSVAIWTGGTSPDPLTLRLLSDRESNFHDDFSVDGEMWEDPECLQKLTRLSPESYIPLARRTLPDDMTDRERLSMLAMGIIGEIGELNIEQTADEVSDVLWYAHLLLDECDRQDIGHSDDTAMVNSITDAVQLTFDATCHWLVETIKKAVFHKVDPENLRTLAVAAFDYCEDQEFVDDLGAIRLANIQKLYQRYPEGFETGGGNRE